MAQASIGNPLRKILMVLGAVLWLALPATASADEAFVGAYAHGVNTPFSIDVGESGADLQVGYRLRPAKWLNFIGKPSPYVIASLNSDGDTSFLGAGLSWKLGRGRIYVRPELGIVVHDGPARKISAKGRYLDLGSRVLFEPGMAVGVNMTPKVAIEASWVHISHGQLCDSIQNPGLDMWGARLNVRL